MKGSVVHSSLQAEICHQAARARRMGSVSKAGVIVTSPHLNTCLRATAEVWSRCTHREDTNFNGYCHSSGQQINDSVI